MKRTRHNPEQIVAKLHQAATELAGGKKIEEVCKSLTISPATYHRWQEQYGGADLNTVKELKALKEENAKLKRLVADLSLDKVALKELLEGKW
jgi:putative transposase